MLPCSAFCDAASSLAVLEEAVGLDEFQEVVEAITRTAYRELFPLTERRGLDATSPRRRVEPSALDME